MINIKDLDIIIYSYEDWEQMVVNGEIMYEGHSLSKWNYIDFIEKLIGHEIKCELGNEEELKQKYG